MTTRFHLSTVVPDLKAAQGFYVDVLGCSLGRQEATWVNIEFFGHQLTLHQARKDNPAVAIDHFGPVLDRDQWTILAQQCRSMDVPFVLEPIIRDEGTAKETGKFLLRDPAGNLLEFKYA